MSFVPRSKHTPSQLQILSWEITAVCSEIHAQLRSTLQGYIIEFLYVLPGGTYSNHCDLYVKTNRCRAKLTSFNDRHVDDVCDRKISGGNML